MSCLDALHGEMLEDVAHPEDSVITLQMKPLKGL